MPLRPLVALLAIFSACLASLSGATAKPNIVYILADDLGFAELGCNGADKFKTPNIDALANSGVRFTRFYTAPLCGPSRSLILTGRYAFRTGAVSQDACKSLVRTGEKAEQMIPTVLKQAGYATALIGKWGQLSPSGSPAEWGFEHDFHFKASGMYWNSARVKTMTDDGKVRGDPDSYVINGKTIPVKDNEYIPDLMHKDAVAWLEAHKGGPFFLYYSMSHVHGEILPTPDSLPNPAGEDAATRLARHYTDNINYMDKLVGKLMAELDRLKLRENTLIVFMGDNGTAKAHAPVATIGGKRLDGEKGSMKEGGGLVHLARRHAVQQGERQRRRRQRPAAHLRRSRRRAAADRSRDRRTQPCLAVQGRHAVPAHLGLLPAQQQLLRPRSGLETRSVRHPLRHEGRSVQGGRRRGRHQGRGRPRGQGPSLGRLDRPEPRGWLQGRGRRRLRPER
jgi:arylsulfatase A-like enzyme